MENALVLIALIAIGVIAVRSALGHFRCQAGCCGGGEYRARRRRLSQVRWKKVFLVRGMHCQGCVNRVMEAVQELQGTSCAVDLKKGRVTVCCDHETDESSIRSVIERAGYEVQAVE